MSNRARGNPAGDADDESPQGPNLVVAYGMVALGLLVAIGFAVLIVWPFYKAR